MISPYYTFMIAPYNILNIYLTKEQYKLIKISCMYELKKKYEISNREIVEYCDKELSEQINKGTNIYFMYEDKILNKDFSNVTTIDFDLDNYTASSMDQYLYTSYFDNVITNEIVLPENGEGSIYSMYLGSGLFDLTYIHKYYVSQLLISCKSTILYKGKYGIDAIQNIKLDNPNMVVEYNYINLDNETGMS